MKQNLTFLSKSPVQEPPLYGPQRGPYGERCSVSRANGLIIHSYLSESPVNELWHKTRVKHTVTVHRAPSGWKAYIQLGVAWFSTLLLLPQCHSAFSTIASTLAWVDQSPISHCVCSNPLHGVPSTPVTASHMTLDTDLHITLQYVRGVGFMGGRLKEKQCR